MSRHRFFVPPESIRGDTVTFAPEQARQISSVLRLRAGDRVIALDGSGVEYEVELTPSGGAVVGRRPNDAEPTVQITLYQGLLKGAKLEMVLQKCTEIGVSRFVPIETARSVAGEPGASKSRRYDAIVREAAEQSGRGHIPEIAPAMTFEAAIQEASEQGSVLIPWEGERRTHIDAVSLGSVDRAGLFIGPEGGFTEEEIDLARAAGAIPVTLGPRILRAETAAIVASALILLRS